MAIEVLDKGLCIAAFYCRWDPDAGPNGTYSLYGQGVRAVESGETTVTVTLTEELPPLLTTLGANDTRFLHVTTGVQNKNGDASADPSLVVVQQETGNRLVFSGFAGIDLDADPQSFWALVFRLPLPFVASAEAPAPP